MRKAKTNGRMKIFAAFLLGFVLAMLIFSYQTEKIVERNVTVEKNVTQNITPIIGYRQSFSHIVAVSTENIGILGLASVEIIPGKGRVLMNTNPFLEPDTQYSAEQAKLAAEKLTGTSLANNDVIISFDLSVYENVSAQVLGGPSAGASMALAMIAAVYGKHVDEGVVITGTIDADGNVGQVGSIIEKAEAAGKHNMKIFLVPKGMGNVTYYEKLVEEKRVGGLIIKKIRYVQKLMTLNDYTQQWNLTTIEIANIGEAVKYIS